MVTVNDVFDAVFVINLDRRPDRELLIRQKMASQGIEFIRIIAVDGLNLDIPSEYINTKMSRGAWGYLFTWESMIDNAIKKGYKKIISFDDDVIFHRDFQSQFKNVIKWLPTNWSIVNLGGSQHTPTEFPTREFFYHPVQTDGSFATCLNATILPELLSEIRKITRVLRDPKKYIKAADSLLPLDSGPLRTIYERHNKDCYIIYPNIVISDVSNSSIRGPRNQEAIARKFGWNLNNYLWPSHPDLVSIIITCYNSESSIEKSILAARLQDYPRCEIIVIDDCSTDSSSLIIQNSLDMDSYANRNLHPLRALRNQVNQGCYNSRNLGITISRGKWIMFQDSDDISVEDRVTIQLNALLRHNVLFTCCLILRSHLQDFSTITSFDRLSIMNQVEVLRTHKNSTGEYKYCCRDILGMVTTLFPRKIFFELGLYWPLPCIADAEFCERILYHKLHKSFDTESDKAENVVQFLTNNSYIKGLYYLVPQILYISEEMKSRNITSQLRSAAESQTIKETYMTMWRARLHGQYDFDYPQICAK